MRTVYRVCKICGDLHNTAAWPDNHVDWIEPARSDVYSPLFIISDNLEPLAGLNGVQNQADGRHYTSKSRLRADYRARGMIEMGNDKPSKRKRTNNRKAIKEAVGRAMHDVLSDGARVENYVKHQKANRKAPLMGRVS